jgi:hypothetical protein
MRVLEQRSRLMVVVLLCIMLSACGCASLTKKFVRKPKESKNPAQSMVLSPEVYPDSRLDKEEMYRHYLALWGGWQDELIDSLSDRAVSRHRQLESLQGAIDNLLAMQALLSEDKQAVAGRYLGSLNALKAAIEKDIYGINKQAARQQAESLKRRINGALQYSQVKDSMK